MFDSYLMEQQTTPSSNLPVPDLASLISVDPKRILVFNPTSISTKTDSMLRIFNNSESTIAYKIRVSVNQLFIIKNTEDFILSHEYSEIPIF